MDAAVVSIIESKDNSNETDSLLRGLKRSVEQLDLKYLDGGGVRPRDAVFQTCIYCKHEAVDEPPENKDVVRTNEERMRVQREAVTEWEAFKNGNGPCPKTSTGKDFKRAPPVPQMESMVLQCHCHQMSCSRRDSDRGSTCIIGCLKSDGERYNWSDGYCTCKLCRCKCKKAFMMDNIARIGIALTQKKT